MTSKGQAMRNVEIDIVDAICSRPIPSGGIGRWGFPSELTPFTGNQWNENWGWDRRAVERLTDDEKDCLWAALKRGGPLGGSVYRTASIREA